MAVQINSHPRTNAAVAAATTATVLAAANPSRKKISFHNAGSATVFIGPSGVTIANGFPLLSGARYEEAYPACTTDAWYGIVATGTCDVRVMENSIS